MRSKTIKASLCFFGVVFLNSVFAQTDEQRRTIMNNSNVQELQRLSVEYDKRFQENYSKALQLAEIEGWNIVFVDEKGNVHELQGVTEEGLPLYKKTLNQGSAITARVNKINTGGDLGLNLNGQNMVVGLWDQNHPKTSHEDFEGRAFVADIAGSTDSFHSTHVLGTMISSGGNNASGRGLAYQAEAWVNDWSSDASEMAWLASLGLLVSNHSYSTAPSPIPLYYFGSYQTDAREIDEITFNAPFYQPVIAAGNDRNEGLNTTKNGNDLLYSKGTSKNGIVVAAVTEVSNYTGPSSVVMSSFSSWGPTDDFRIKPDISAKGVNVLSTSNTSNKSYSTSQGTSMAAPAVSAVLILLQQHYNNLHGTTMQPYMRSATLRGLIIHTASEAGPADGPDHMYGWGLIDAEKSASVLSGKGTSSIIEEQSLPQSQTYTLNVKATGTEPLVVTLSWTDRPGTVNGSSVIDPISPRLRNDLDVRVFKDQEEYFPWTLTKDFDNPVAIKADNNVDNVEKIEIANPVANGIYTIVVSHKGILVNGQAQDFSLIVTGVDATLSTNDYVAQDVISVWPNPVDDVLSLTANFEEDVNISLYDVRGVKLMSENKFLQGKMEIDMLPYEKGMYLLVVQTDQKSFVQKVYKK